MKTFDIETSVSKWRADLAAGDGISTDALEELESHLREGMDDLRKGAQLSAEESFLIAARRIGKTSALDSEFSQVSTHTVWKRRVFWMLLGFVDISATLAIISLLGYVGTWSGVAFGAPEALPIWSILSHGGAVLLIAAIAIIAWRFLIGNPQIVAEHFGRYPIFCAIAVVLVLVAVKAGSTVISLVMTRTSTVEEVGLVALQSNYASFALNAVVIVSICVALAVLAKSLLPKYNP